MRTEKILSFIGAVIIPAPLAITALVSVYGELALLPFLLSLLAGAAAWLLGQLLGFLLKNAGKKSVYAVRAGVLAAGALIIAFCEIILAISEAGSLSVIFMPPALIFWYWFGYRAGAKYELLPYAALGTYCAEAAFMFPICRAFEEKNGVGGNAILAITAVIVAAGAVIINRRNLARLSFRGKAAENILSRSVSKSNLKMTLTVAAVILAMFFFAGWGAKWLWEGIRALLALLVNLFVNMGSNIDTQLDGDIDPIDAVSLVNENPLAQIVLLMLTAVTVLLLLKPIVKAIKNFIKFLRQKFGKIEAAAYGEFAYADIYEQSSKGKKNKSSFKKAYRAFRREKEPCAKYRLGYRAFMLALSEKGKENTPSDTTAVHFEKGRDIVDDEALKRVIDKYEKLRYCDRDVSSKDCEEIDKLLCRLR